VLGSSIPLVLYLGWIFACVGGGIDTSAVLGGLAPGENMSGAAVLLSIFSFVTIGGSTLCGSISVSEELDTYLRREKDDDSKTSKHIDVTEVAPAFHASSAVVALGVPLFAAITCASGDQGQGLTGALALAGSFGSPLLYGAIPALMAHRQLKHHHSIDSTSNNDFLRLQTKVSHPLVPSACLPAIGALSVGYVCQEMTHNLLSIVA
jgi:Tryptophan/tyrosine permease family